MAKKKAPSAPTVPTAERVAQAVRAGDFVTAIEMARQLHAAAPTTEHQTLLKRTLADAAANYADRNKTADFNRVLAEADLIEADDPAWIAEHAVLLARGGRLTEALARADDATRPKVLAQAADRAVRQQTKEWLPADLHAGFDAVISAFRHYEAGNDAAAREALEPIGLRSPFLEWKVLLRGLTAHANRDDARAAENFTRLDPARLPARLAAPYRFQVDTAFQTAQPAGIAAQLAAQSQKLTTGPILDHLRAIARDLGREKPMTPVFREAGEVLPHLRKTAPAIVPKLANCLYHALIQQGQPDDMGRYRRVFGDPVGDPQFNKLQAQIYEQLGKTELVQIFWKKYEEWLAGNPLGWPPEVTARARAIVWTRLGENARKALEEPDDEDDLIALFGSPRRKKKPKPLEPPAEVCFARAAELAPDWPHAHRKLFDALIAVKKQAQAEAAARAFLTRQPNDLPLLIALASLLQSQGQSDDAAILWQRVIAINPLDKAARFRTATAILAHARLRLTSGDAAAAEAVFEANRPLLDEQAPSAFHALRSVVKTKLGQSEEAAALREQALAVPGGRLGAAYRIMVDSLLAKLKPADKRAADKLFADELTKPPLPLEVNQLIGAYDAYHIDGVTYRGQKTHDKKVLDQAARCLSADAPEEDFERLCELLLIKREWKPAKKLADGAITRFPNNPYFLFARSQVGRETNERSYAVEDRLHRAKQLAQRSTEPRHHDLVARIDELLARVVSPFHMFDAFFG